MIKVFYSYSHRDAADLQILTDVYMSPLVRSGRIEHWYDKEISAGKPFGPEIDKNLDAADVVVLLLSPHFFASDYTVDIELERALQRHAEGTVRVVPVLLHSVLQRSLRRLKDLQILPRNLEPVHSPATPTNDAWVRVVEEIERVVDELERLDGYPEQVAHDLRECWARLEPRYVERFLRPGPQPPADSTKLLSRRGTTGYRWRFRRGSIYWSGLGGARPVWGEIGRVYHELGGCTGELGFPLTDEGTAEKSRFGSAGRYQRFEGAADTCANDRTGIRYGASIYWRQHDRATFATQGAIGCEFEGLDGTTGPLGFPVSADEPVKSPSGTRGRGQSFEGGGLYEYPGHGTHAVTGQIHEVYSDADGVRGRFGFPLGPQRASDGRLLQEFEGGIIVIVLPTGAPTRVSADAASAGRVVSLTAGSFRPGHHELFAALRDGRIVHRANYGAGWGEWMTYHTSSALFTALTCCSRKDDDWELYAVDAAGALTHRWYHYGDTWSDWHPMETPQPVVSVASGSMASGHQELLVATDDGTVFHRWQWGGDGWSDWTVFDADIAVRSLSCASPGPGALEVFAVDADGRLHHRGYAEGGSWSRWSAMAAPDRVTALSYGTTRTGHRELFAALAGGGMVHAWYRADGWSEWRPFGLDESVVALANASHADRDLEVFAGTGAGRMMNRWYRPGQDDWSHWDEAQLPE